MRRRRGARPLRSPPFHANSWNCRAGGEPAAQGLGGRGRLRSDADLLHRPTDGDAGLQLHGEARVQRQIQPVRRCRRGDRCSRAKFETWRPAFWDNLATSVQLHNLTRVIAIDHRDCGAARIAYGDNSIANPQIETKTHREVLAEFREAVAQHHPQLTVETGVMALDGSIEMFPHGFPTLFRGTSRSSR